MTIVVVLSAESNNSPEPKEPIDPSKRSFLLASAMVATAAFAQEDKMTDGGLAEIEDKVLRPGTNWLSIMQPTMSYELGYCRPECTRCSDVCSAGAIKPITKELKSSIQIGHAVWVKKNCIPLTDGVSCGNCARHCPVGAIEMVPSDPDDEESLKIPVVNEARCIGCGACENLCPARPFSAIYVEGHEVHKEV